MIPSVHTNNSDSSPSLIASETQSPIPSMAHTSSSPPRAPSMMIDSNSYQLHSGDNPGILLVTQPLIGYNNQTWSRSMLMALTGKNKAGFIDGYINSPDLSSPLYGSWKKCNTMVLSWLFNSLSGKIAASVIYLDSAHEVWLDLKERFSQSSDPRIYQLQKAIATLNQGQTSVSSYYTKLKGLWDELINFRPIPTCSCGALKTLHEYQHSEYVMKFLVGLNDTFGNVKGQILLMDPLPSINKVFPLVTQEERQRDLTPSSMVQFIESTAAFAVTNSRFNSGTKNYGKKERPMCSHCVHTRPHSG